MENKTLETKRVVNCTPHAVNILSAESFMYKGVTPKVRLSFPTSDFIARLVYDTRLVERFLIENHVVDVTSTKYGRVLGLPQPEPGVIYIVSKLVAEALYGVRDDVFILSGLARNSVGKTLGGRSLARLQTLTR